MTNKTIAAGNVVLKMKADGVLAEANKIKNEMRTIRTIIKQSTPDTTRYAAETKALAEAFKRGDINGGQYARSQEFLAQKYNILTEAQQRAKESAERLAAAQARVREEAIRSKAAAESLTNAWAAASGSAGKYSLLNPSSLASYGKAIDQSFLKQEMMTRSLEGMSSKSSFAAGGFSRITAAAGMFAGVLATAKLSMDVFARNTEGIDNLAKFSRVLDEDYNQLKQFSAAMSEVAGLDLSQSLNTLIELQRVIGQSSLTGRNKALFDSLGIDAKRLSEMGTLQAFNEISDAIGRLKSNAERGAAAMKLFGDQRVATAVGAYASELKAAQAGAANSTLPMSKEAVADVERMNDMISRVRNSLGSIKDRLWGEIASGMVNGFGMQQVAESAQAAVGPMTEAARNAKLVADAEKAAADEAARYQAIKEASDNMFVGENESLMRQIQTLQFGAQAAADSARLRAGMSEDQRNFLIEQENYLEKLQKEAETHRKMADDAKKLEDLGKNLRDKYNPFETLKKQVEDVNELYRRGAISQFIAMKELEKMAMDYAKENSSGSSGPLTPSMMNANSSEAYKWVMNKQEELRKMEQQKKIAADSLKVLQDISRGIDRIPQMGVAG